MQKDSLAHHEDKVLDQEQESSQATDFYFLFLIYSDPNWSGLARGGRTVCVSGCFKRDLGI